jgi:hypothetical protein
MSTPLSWITHFCLFKLSDSHVLAVLNILKQMRLGKNKPTNFMTSNSFVIKQWANVGI